MIKSILATLFVVGVTAPALAQEQCNNEVQAVWAEVQQSDIDDANKNQVADVLNNALAQGQAGDEAACLQTVQQVKVALNMEQ